MNNFEKTLKKLTESHQSLPEEFGAWYKLDTIGNSVIYKNRGLLKFDSDDGKQGVTDLEAEVIYDPNEDSYDLALSATYDDDRDREHRATISYKDGLSLEDVMAQLKANDNPDDVEIGELNWD